MTISSHFLIALKYFTKLFCKKTYLYSGGFFIQQGHAFKLSLLVLILFVSYSIVPKNTLSAIFWHLYSLVHYFSLKNSVLVECVKMPKIALIECYFFKVTLQ